MNLWLTTITAGFEKSIGTRVTTANLSLWTTLGCSIVLAISTAYFFAILTTPRTIRLRDSQQNSSYDNAGWLSRLFFSWTVPLLRSQGVLANTWTLAEEDTAFQAYQKFQNQWKKTQSWSPNSLWTNLIRTFGSRLILIALFKIIADISKVTVPLLFHNLINALMDEEKATSETRKHELWTVSTIFGLLVVQAVSRNQDEFLIMRLGIRVESALSMAIYEKTTRLSTESRETNPSGSIANHLVVDVKQIKDCIGYAHRLWSIPLQVAFALYSLYRLLGIFSAFTAFLAVLAIIPINTMASKPLQATYVEQRKHRDARMILITEMLTHIKVLRRQGVSLAWANFVWNLGPFVVTILSIAAYFTSRQARITPEIAFPTLALLDLLNQPLAGYSYAIAGVSRALSAMQRISKYLQQDELQVGKAFRLPSSSDCWDAVAVENAVFVSHHSKYPILSIPRLILRKGLLYCIVGNVGSGKSTILDALNGRVRMSHGTTKVYGTVAFVAQSPWLSNGSIKENIIFGRALDPELYKVVIEACALGDDIANMKEGDETQIGENGLKLSGGQKTRVTLARAIYTKSDIYLLDDVLAAVDVHVRKHLLYHVLGPQGILQGATRIITTSSHTILRQADLVFKVENGKLKAIDGYRSEDIMLQDTPKIPSSDTNSAITLPIARESKSSDFSNEKGSLLTANESSQQQQHSNWSLLILYVKTCRVHNFLLYLAAVIAYKCLSTWSEVWIGIWTSKNMQNEAKEHPMNQFAKYIAIGMLPSMASGLQMYFLQAQCSLQASKALYRNLSCAIVNSPMTFFEKNEIGDILTLFSTNTNQFDDRLARFFNSTLSPSIRAAITLGVIIWSNPRIAAAVLPLAFWYLRIQAQFLPASQSLHRLQGMSSGATFTHLQSVYSGIATITAFQQLDRFSGLMHKTIDSQQKILFAVTSMDLWLSIRLELIGAAIMAIVSCVAVLTSNHVNTSAGFIGVALVNAHRITSILSLQVRSAAFLESHLSSYRRLLAYTSLPCEGESGVGALVPSTWPTRGKVSFQNYSMRYQPSLSDALRNVNVTFQGGQKIGVVGRTGAGKSSMVLALLRLVEGTQGEIFIDGIPISQIPLSVLRSRLAIIPQDASIFRGTIRFNLDPHLQHNDDEIWAILKQVQLRSYVESLPNQLLTSVQNSDSILSVGQRQLIAFARVLLRKPKVLILDEATASVDSQTDDVVQLCLTRQDLADVTVITIAHRIKTVLKYDKILVLRDGKVVEFGKPDELMIKSRFFYSLMKESEVQKEI